MAQISEVFCPTCRANVAMRISRSGFLQLNVLGRMGIYPWKCGACGCTFLSRHRGEKPGPRRQESRPGANYQQRGA